MTDVMKFYEDVKDKLGEEIKIGRTMSKREFKEDGWKYTLFFDNGKLMKVEAFNHRELIEIYNK